MRVSSPATGAGAASIPLRLERPHCQTMGGAALVSVMFRPASHRNFGKCAFPNGGISAT